MKLKKILATALAFVVMGAALPFNEAVMNNTAVYADSVYTEGTYETLTYKKYIDHVEISDCDETATEVEIPAEIDGVPVTSIGDEAFYYCESLTSITIPDGVTSIGEKAFYYCESLTSITIPDSVTSIGAGAFDECSRLTSINVSDNNLYYASVNGVLLNKELTELITYPCGKDETEYAIPDSVTSIGVSAFSQCYGLTSITIPDSVTSIGNYAFFGCDSLTSITIPDCVTSIGNGAFSWCDALISITIPDSVTSIGNEAFFYCRSLTSITIPDSVTSIGDYAFKSCRSLTSITIPDSVTSIGYEAFYDCNSLTSITIENPNCEIYGSEGTISDTATIYGYEGSTAQAYAEKYNKKFEIISSEPSTDIVLGDANQDGKVLLNDAVLILQYLGNPDVYKMSPEGMAAADVSNPGDGITNKDALAVQKFILHLIPELPENS